MDRTWYKTIIKPWFPCEWSDRFSQIIKSPAFALNTTGYPDGTLSRWFIVVNPSLLPPNMVISCHFMITWPIPDEHWDDVTSWSGPCLSYPSRTGKASSTPASPPQQITWSNPTLWIGHNGWSHGYGMSLASISRFIMIHLCIFPGS